jgi:ABC-2 type transport system permease protein
MWQLVIKDLRLFARDKKSLALTFLLPIVLISVFFFAFGGASDNGDSNAPIVSLLLADLDSTSTSNEFVSRLDSLTGLRLEKRSDTTWLRENVANGKRAAGLVLYEGFGTAVLTGNKIPAELIFDSGRPMEMGILAQILNSEFGAFAGQYMGKAQAKNQMMNQFGISEEVAEEFLSQADESEEAKSGAYFTASEVVGDRNNDFSLIQAVAGTAVMLLLFSVASMGASLLAEKEEGTLKKLLLTPISPMQILYGKLLSTSIIAIIQLLIMFVFAAIAFNLNLLTNLPALLLMVVLTAVSCASLGVMLAAICTSRKQVDGMATIIILIMSSIGGSMMPVVFMPAFIQKLAVGTINYWSIQGFYDIYWRLLPFSDVLDNAAVLLAITGVAITIAMIFFKKNIIKLI